MNEILQKSIFGPLDMYRLLTCGFMLVLYGSYSYIKKKNPKNLIYISNITLVISVIYIMTNLLLKEFSQDVYTFIIPFIVVSFLLRNQAIHDKRGSKVYEIINLQKKWGKIDIMFIPKEFEDDEINIIYNILKEIFDRINTNIASNNIGGLFIKISKRRKIKKINIINVLSENKKEELEKLKKIYDDIGKKNYGDLTIDEGKINRVELDIVI